MLHFGKKALMAISLGAMTLTGTMAMAQPGSGRDNGGFDNRRDDNRPGDNRGNNERRDNDRRENGRRDDDRRGNDRRDIGRPNGWAQNGNGWRSNDRNQRNWRNYDYNRFEQGGRGYYAENYYRSGGSYRPIRVTRNTRIYRGYNGNYYCRRNDGTTGLIVGAALGGVVGNGLDNGGSSLLATLLGAGAGGLLGREIDRGGVSCR